MLFHQPQSYSVFIQLNSTWQKVNRVQYWSLTVISFINNLYNKIDIKAIKDHYDHVKVKSEGREPEEVIYINNSVGST